MVLLLCGNKVNNAFDLIFSRALGKNGINSVQYTNMRLKCYSSSSLRSSNSVNALSAISFTV